MKTGTIIFGAAGVVFCLGAGFLMDLTKMTNLSGATLMLGILFLFVSVISHGDKYK